MTRSLICFRSLKSLISSLNIDTSFLGFFSGLIMTLTNMNIDFCCATTESDKPRILKGGFRPIKRVMYANVFQDLIRSFALGYLKIYRHVLVNDATSNTKNRAERWRTSLIIQWISILCLLSVTDVILGWVYLNSDKREGEVWCDFDVTTVSISRNNRLRRPGSLRQLPQLYNKKVKNIFMFTRYVHTTSQDLEAWSVAVVVEFSQRSKCFKLLVTDSTCRKRTLFGSSLAYIQTTLGWSLQNHTCFKNLSGRKLPTRRSTPSSPTR